MKVAAFWQPFVRGYAPLFGLPKQTTTNLSAVIATCYCNLRKSSIIALAEHVMLEHVEKFFVFAKEIFADIDPKYELNVK